MPKLRECLDVIRSLVGIIAIVLVAALAVMIACGPSGEVSRRADFLRDCAVLANVGETGVGCPTLTPAPTPSPTPTSIPTATAVAEPTPTSAPTAMRRPHPTPTITPMPRPTRTPTPTPAHPAGPTLTPEDARIVLSWADEGCIYVMPTEDKLGGCISYRGFCYLVENHADRWYEIDRRFAPPDAPFEDWVLYIGRADAEAYCAAK